MYGTLSVVYDDGSSEAYAASVGILDGYLVVAAIPLVTGGGSAESAVLYTDQELTPEEQAQARANVDAVGKAEKVSNTINLTVLDMIDKNYAKSDGTYGVSTLYVATKSMPIDFDVGSTITARCAIIGNAGLTIHDANDSVLLFVDGTNAATYGVTPGKYLQEVSVTVPTGAAYIRISAVKHTEGETKPMYKSPDDLYIRGVRTMHTVEVLNQLNNEAGYVHTSDVLYGKKLACVGDSITEAVNPDGGNFYNYAELVAQRHKMTVYKDGMGGSTMANSKAYAFCVDRYLNVPADFDILTIWFGWNDAAYSQLGTINDTEDTTYYGAYKKVLDYFITTYPTKKIGLIVPYGGENTDPFKVAVRELSEMYGVPCLDLADGKQCSLLWGVDNDAQLARRNALTYDTTHPNQAGHVYLSTMYEAFIKRL